MCQDRGWIDAFPGYDHQQWRWQTRTSAAIKLQWACLLCFRWRVWEYLGGGILKGHKSNLLSMSFRSHQVPAYVSDRYGALVEELGSCFFCDGGVSKLLHYKGWGWNPKKFSPFRKLFWSCSSWLIWSKIPLRINFTYTACSLPVLAVVISFKPIKKFSSITKV